MIPILPANEVKIVRPFLVIKLFKLRDKAVKKFIDVFPVFAFFFSVFSSSSLYGFESLITFPSSTFITLDEYFSASSGLCVTIIINLSFEIFFNISII